MLSENNQTRFYYTRRISGGRRRLGAKNSRTTDQSIVCCAFVTLHAQVIDPTKRFGCEECGGYPALKAHSFYKGKQTFGAAEIFRGTFALIGIKWETLHKQTPPSIMPYLPSTSKDGESLHSDFRVRREVSVK